MVPPRRMEDAPLEIRRAGNFTRARLDKLSCGCEENLASMGIFVSSLEIAQVEKPAVCIFSPDTSDNFRPDSHLWSEIVGGYDVIDILFDFLV